MAAKERQLDAKRPAPPIGPNGGPPLDDLLPSAPDLLSFDDLRAAKIVMNRVTLARWQKDNGFPKGFLIGANSRRFPKRAIVEWLRRRQLAEDKPAAPARAGRG